MKMVFSRSCYGCPRTRGRATSRSSTFLSRETRKRIGKVHVAFVTRGTAAITCQLWGTVCPVCLSLERESTEGGSCPDVGAEGGRGLRCSLSLGLMIPVGSHYWLRPTTWLANECRTMGGSAHGAAHGTCRRGGLHLVCITATDMCMVHRGR